MLTILFFGQLKEQTGVASINVEEVENTDELISLLSIRYPQLKELSFTIAVNKQVTTENTILAPNATIALLPPYSGG